MIIYQTQLVDFLKTAITNPMDPPNNEGGLLSILILVILNIATNNKKHTKKNIYPNFPLKFHKTWTLTFFNQT
jgi:hypothetical protein